MKKLWLPLLFSLLVCAALIIFSFQIQQEIKVIAPDKPPQRIVSLAPNITEILFALGLGDKIVAVSDDSDYPPEAAKNNKIGTFWKPSTESIIADKTGFGNHIMVREQKSVADTLRTAWLSCPCFVNEKFS